MRLLLSFFLTLSAALLLSGAAQEKQEKCDHCDTPGLVACKGSSCQAKACATDLDHVCDSRYRSKCCQGFRHLLCEKCKSREGILQQREFKAKRKAWLKYVKEVDNRVGMRFSHVETANFFVHNSHTSWRFQGSGKKERADGAHIWAERAENAAKDVVKYFGTPKAPKTSNEKHHIYLTWSVDENMAAFRGFERKLDYAKNSFRYGFLGDTCHIFGFPDQTSRYTDKGLHAFVYHHAACATIGRLGKKRRIPNWFGIGATHWLDLLKFKRKKEYNEYQVNKNQTSKNAWFVKANWPKLIAKRLKKESVLLGSILKKKEFELLKEHAICWSMVNFLMKKKHRSKMKTLTLTLSTGYPFEKALDQAYNMDLDEFEAAWRRHAILGRP